MHRGEGGKKIAQVHFAAGIFLSLSFIAAAEPPLPFKVGERLSLNVSWSDRMSAATMTLAVAEKRMAQGVPCYVLKAEVMPTPVIRKIYPVHYQAESILDAVTLLPQKASMYNREGPRVRQKFTFFDRPGKRIFYTYQTKTVQKKVLAAPPGVRDILSWLYFLRTLPLREGLSERFPITDNGRLFVLQCRLKRGAPVKTDLGELPVWRIEPRLEDEQGKPSPLALVLWLSGDARRLPLRFEVALPVGKFVAMMSHVSQ